MGNVESLFSLLILFRVVNHELPTPIRVPLFVEVGDQCQPAKRRTWAVSRDIRLIGIIMRGEAIAHPVGVIIEI